MTALVHNIRGGKRRRPTPAGERASLDELSLLDSDIDDLDPTVIKLIDALARAQAVEDHSRETVHERLKSES